MNLMNVFTSLVPLFMALSQKCPAIGSLRAGASLFSIAAATNAGIKFYFRNPKEGTPKKVGDGVGLALLGFGIWLVAITFPEFKNRKVLTAKGECESGIFYSATICAAIIAAVLVGLVCYGIYYLVSGKGKE